MSIGIKAANVAKFRKVIEDRKLTAEDIQELIRKHVAQKYPDDMFSQNIAASNMRKEFAHYQMSDRYLVKALGILGLNEAEIAAVVDE
jgi:hypothetical protein